MSLFGKASVLLFRKLFTCPAQAKKEEVLVTTHNEHSGRHMKDLYGVGGRRRGGANAEGWPWSGLLHTRPESSSNTNSLME